MIDYELAKELKEAGFPSSKVITKDSIRIGGWFSPTLSELIEACGDGFGGMNKYPPAPDYERWEAHTEWVFEIGKDPNDHKYVTYGKTPEEAVARLFIALNQE